MGGAQPSRRVARPRDSGAGVPSGRAADEPSTRELSAVRKGALFGVCCAGSVVATCGDGVVALRDWQRAGGRRRGVARARPVSRVVRARAARSTPSRDQTLCAWSDSEAPLAGSKGTSSRSPRSRSTTAGRRCAQARASPCCCGTSDRRDGALVENFAQPRPSLKWVPTEPAVVQGRGSRLRVWVAHDGSKARSDGRVHVLPLCIDIAPGRHGIVTGRGGLPRFRLRTKVWDRRMETILFELRGHQQDTTGAVYLPRSGGGERKRVADDRHRVQDQTVKLWDANAGELVASAAAEAGMYTGLSAPPCASGLETPPLSMYSTRRRPWRFARQPFQRSHSFDEQGTGRARRGSSIKCQSCWQHARAAAVPALALDLEKQKPLISDVLRVVLFRLVLVVPARQFLHSGLLLAHHRAGPVRLYSLDVDVALSDETGAVVAVELFAP